MSTTRNPRRTLRSGVAGAVALAAALLLAGCGGAADAGGGAKLALDAPLPTTVPDGAKIVVGDPTTQKALELSGQIDKVSKFVQFANLSGGPQTTEDRRAAWGKTALQPGGRAGLVKWKRRWASSGARFTQPWLRTRPKLWCQKAPCRAMPLAKYCT